MASHGNLKRYNTLFRQLIDFTAIPPINQTRRQAQGQVYNPYSLFAAAQHLGQQLAHLVANPFQASGIGKQGIEQAWSHAVLFTRKRLQRKRFWL